LRSERAQGISSVSTLSRYDGREDQFRGDHLAAFRNDMWAECSPDARVWSKSVYYIFQMTARRSVLCVSQDR